MATPFQDQMRDNGCFGCGPDNPDGLKLKSVWDGDESVARFMPQPHMTAGPPQYLNGGIIATVIDCHAVCTASADAHRRAGTAIGEGEVIWYVTGKLEVSYRAPVPIDREIELRARVESAAEKKSIVSVRLLSDDRECATAEVIAVRVPPSWLD